MALFWDVLGLLWTPAVISATIFLLLLCLGVLTKAYLLYTSGRCLSKASMRGKTVIITGGNSGIGKETAKKLARRKARVILACRNTRKAEEAAREIFEETERDVVVKHLDLASFKSVREFAADIIKTEPRLDVLINNAGMVNYWSKPRLTEDGCEVCFQTNYLGHFLLTVLLAGLMKKSAPSRVINVTSDMHIWGSIQRLQEKVTGSYSARHPAIVYADTKRAQLVSTRALARKLKPHGITVNAVHPGLTKTGIGCNSSSPTFFLFKYVMRYFGKTCKEGAQTSIQLAVDPMLGHETGAYFADNHRRRFEIRFELGGPSDEEEEELIKNTSRLVGVDGPQLEMNLDGL